MKTTTTLLVTLASLLSLSTTSPTPPLYTISFDPPAPLQNPQIALKNITFTPYTPPSSSPSPFNPSSPPPPPPPFPPALTVLSTLHAYAYSIASPADPNNWDKNFPLSDRFAKDGVAVVLDGAVGGSPVGGGGGGMGLGDGGVPPAREARLKYQDVFQVMKLVAKGYKQGALEGGEKFEVWGVVDGKGMVVMEGTIARDEGVVG